MRDGPDGSYRFLPGIAAYSSGVVATRGWEIVHATPVCTAVSKLIVTTPGVMVAPTAA